MKDLNSVLLEGNVKTVVQAEGEEDFRIIILDTDIFGSYDKSVISVTINIPSSIGHIREGVIIGRHIRIVGRLGVGNSGALIVIAEHVEIHRN